MIQSQVVSNPDYYFMEMWAINTNKCLPQELTVQSVEDIIHRIGLTLDSNKTYPKRNLFFNPIIIFVFLILYIIREIIIISLTEENDHILKVLGSIGHFIGIREHVSIVLILLSLLGLSFQLIYYNNYRNGIKPTFLRVFQMMSGLVSPKSLGLTDEQQIRKLLKTTKTLIICIKIDNNFIAPIIAVTLMNTCYLFKANLIESLCYGVPNSIIYAIWAVYSTNLVIYQLLILIIISSYLKMKINSLNERLLEIQRRKRFIRIRETLQSFDSLYSEINEYNTTFWSKILFFYWTILGTMVVFNTYVCIFGKFGLINKVLILYITSIWIMIFSMVIFTASSVTYCANKSYKTLNSMFISYSKHNKHLYYATRFSTKNKVVFNNFLSFFILITYL